MLKSVLGSKMVKEEFKNTAKKTTFYNSRCEGLKGTVLKEVTTKIEVKA